MDDLTWRTILGIIVFAIGYYQCLIGLSDARKNNSIPPGLRTIVWKLMNMFLFMFLSLLVLLVLLLLYAPKG